MNKRSPRCIRRGKPLLITQKAIKQVTLFPSITHYCSFVSKLEENKRRYFFTVLAYGLTPDSVYLILDLNKNNLPNVTKSLFTSAATKLRRSEKHCGRVYLGNFSSQILTTDAIVKNTKHKIGKAIQEQLAGSSGDWPYFATSQRNDVFGIIDKTKRHDDKKIKTIPPAGFLTKNGLPKLNWYITLAESITHHKTKKY